MNREIRDFNTIIFTKRSPKKDVSVKKTVAPKNILAKIDNEEIRMLPISIEQSQQIQNARKSKNMTRKEFAIKCNIAQSVIADYENAKAIPKNSELKIINKVLGINIKPNKPVSIQEN